MSVVPHSYTIGRVWKGVEIFSRELGLLAYIRQRGSLQVSFGRVGILY